MRNLFCSILFIGIISVIQAQDSKSSSFFYIGATVGNYTNRVFEDIINSENIIPYSNPNISVYFDFTFSKKHDFSSKLAFGLYNYLHKSFEDSNISTISESFISFPLVISCSKLLNNDHLRLGFEIGPVFSFLSNQEKFTGSDKLIISTGFNDYSKISLYTGIILKYSFQKTIFSFGYNTSADIISFTKKTSIIKPYNYFSYGPSFSIGLKL